MKSEIKSPCIKVCKYDEDGFCMGCYRSREEISGWLFMSDEQKTEVLESADIRRKTPKAGQNDYEYYV